MPDGTMRDGDNWQNGIPLDVYMKSLVRHMIDVWLHHRGLSEQATESLDDAIGGVIFNAMGYWFEELESHNAEAASVPGVGGYEWTLADNLGGFDLSVDGKARSAVEGAPITQGTNADWAKWSGEKPIQVGDMVRPVWMPYIAAKCVESVLHDGKRASIRGAGDPVAQVFDIADLVKS